MGRQMTTLNSAPRNVVANFIGVAGVSVLTLLFNYIYYRMMGDESYGLVVLLATLMTIVGALDLGLSRTTARELARRATTPELSATSRSTVMTLHLIQWVVVGVLGATIAVMAPFIATYTLKSRTVSHETIALSIAIIGVIVSVAQPRYLYISGLNGILKSTSDS